MKFHIIRLLAALLPAFFSCLAYSQHHANTIATADSFYVAGDYRNAVRLYEEILKDTSRRGLSWNRLGYAYYNTGNPDAAMRSYKKALSFSPSPMLKASVYSRMAVINAQRGNRAQLYASLDSAINSGYNLYTELDSIQAFKIVRDESRFKNIRLQAYNSAYPCMNNAQARQFDFWVGEWDAFVTGTKQLAGHSVIQIISGGCAILENWSSARIFYSGKSLNFIDPSTNKWRQNWVGSGDSQDFENGEYKDGAMRFTYSRTDPKGHKTIGRFIFYNQGPGQVRQFNESSDDDGKTWTSNYDFTYIRTK